MYVGTGESPRPRTSPNPFGGTTDGKSYDPGCEAPHDSLSQGVALDSNPLLVKGSLELLNLRQQFTEARNGGPGTH